MSQRLLLALAILTAASCASQPVPAPATPGTQPTAPPGPSGLPPPVGESPAGAASTPPLVAPTTPIPPPPTPTPTAPAVRSSSAILADAVKAMGGEAAFAAHKTKRMKVEIVFERMGITGAGEELATSAGKMLMTTDLPGIGTLKEGSNGKSFWAEDPINGLRALTGAEAEQLRQASSWCPELHATELFPKIEVKNEVGPGNAPLECLVLTPRVGSAITSCYDASTHLQVLQKGSHSTPQGETPFLSVLKDWRDVGGIKMSYAVDTQEGPLTFSLRVLEVKLDEPMDDKVFEMPSAKGAGDAKEPAPAKGKAKPKAAPKK